MKYWRPLGAAVAALALSACATLKPTAQKQAPAVTPPAKVSSSAVPPPAPPPPAPPPTFWESMRAHFAMPGCDADPVIAHWAHRLTRRPRAFEDRLRWALPTLTYIEAAAREHNVATEFALLPWIESRFRAEWPRRGGSAGMWQIVPITAHTLKLPIRRDYDGRLDREAATDAVMRMLHRYHQRWRDWRLVDMAYNAGEFRIRHQIANGPAPQQPVIPDLHVSGITRHHLIQLIAMACVIRQPQRFGIHLPKVDENTRLTVVELPKPINMATAAQLSGLPERRLHTLNAAYLQGRMPAGVPHRLMLPAPAAKRFLQAYAELLKHPRADENAAQVIRPPRYRVGRGDSLWSIAHRFHLSVHELRHWNHLRSSMLHPGHMLRLYAPR